MSKLSRRNVLKSVLSGVAMTSLPSASRVAWVAALLTIPVAGTALYVMDQYLNPRNLAAFVGVFAVVRVLEKKFLRALACLILAGVVHPLMAAFACSYCALLLVTEKFEKSLAAAESQAVRAATAVVCLLPFGISLATFDGLFCPASRRHRERPFDMAR
jgi:hypothetical protein